MRYSIAPEAARGGDLGFFARGDMPEEFDVVFNLKEGEISEIVQSPYGYHIFQLVSKRGETMLGFAEVKEQIRNEIVHRREEKTFEDWLKKLKKNVHIRINTKALAKLKVFGDSEHIKEKNGNE